jgi:hypothetical protein
MLQGSWFRVQGSSCRVPDSWFRVHGSRFIVRQSSSFRAHGSGYGV